MALTIRFRMGEGNDYRTVSSGEGAFDFARGRELMTMSFFDTGNSVTTFAVPAGSSNPSPLPTALPTVPSEPAFTPPTLRTVTDGDHTFLECPGGEEGRRRWIKIQGPPANAIPIGPLSPNPVELFDQMKRVAGRVEEVGSERIRGTPTTHYKFTLRASLFGAPSGYSSGRAGTTDSPQPDPKMDAWIDSDGLPRKLVVREETSESGIEFATEIFDYGASLSIPIPNDIDIIDVIDHPDKWATSEGVEAGTSCFGAPSADHQSE